MVVLPPRVFHQGFNVGYNVAEARNCAPPLWVERFAENATACDCKAYGATSVKTNLIGMMLNKYNKWKLVS